MTQAIPSLRDSDYGQIASHQAWEKIIASQIRLFKSHSESWRQQSTKYTFVQCTSGLLY